MLYPHQGQPLTWGSGHTVWGWAKPVLAKCWFVQVSEALLKLHLCLSCMQVLKKFPLSSSMALGTIVYSANISHTDR